MSEPSLWTRIKRARIVQVLIVYVGASWVILQLADVLTNTAGLPQWVGAFTLLLLAVGLVIILATAWVQSLPTTTAAEEAGERPTDWEVAPAEALASLKAGRLPHLTWGRAIGGGVVALSLLFGGAGVYVLVTGRNAPGFGPEEVAAGEAADGIAVVPFTVTGGEDLTLWREGMVDLLSTNLDGLGGFRTIDSRTVMARWRERVSGDETPDLNTVLTAAGATDARYALVGTVVGNPAGIRVSADVYDLSSGDKVAQAVEQGGADDMLDVTSRLSVGLVRSLLGASGSSVVQSERLEALTTSSLPALRAYLEGEAAMRRADFADAAAAYERAVGLDSLFALAWYRLSDAYGWLEDIGSPAGARASEQALTMLDRLPVRERILVQASEAARSGDTEFYQTLRDAVQRYPDDPDIWYNLGDFIYHVALPVGLATREQAAEAFDQAIALDPGFGPYQVHPIEFAVARGDRAEAEARVARYEEATDDPRHENEYELAIPLLMGDSTEAAAAVQASLGVDMGILGRIRTELANRTDRNDRLLDLEWANRDRAGADHQWVLYLMGSEGALARADRLLDSLNVPASTKGVATGYWLGSWITAKDLPHHDVASPSTCEAPAVSTQCQMFVGWGRARSGDLTVAKASARILREHEADPEDADATETIGLQADVVEGAIASAEGRTADARRLLRPAVQDPGVPGSLARISLGEMELAAGNISEGTRYLRGDLGTYHRMLATLLLARLHDRRGETEEALEYYRSFVTMTRRGDPDLPEIVEARAALERPGG